MTPEEFKTKLENARLRTAVQYHRLEMCGKRITLSKRGYRRCVKHFPKRGIITEFSRRARSAKLRRIAEVNWAKTGHSVMITLTYPDAVSDHTMDERKNHRYLINRWLCKTLGRQFACFWRVEWLPRLSGQFVGQLRPHMHLLYLDCPTICEMKVRVKWMNIIGVRTYTQVNVKPLEIAEAVGVYVAKYCAKEATNLLLEDVPKRNRRGRHAGELRKELIPIHDREVIERVNEAIVLAVKGRACEVLWWFDPRFDEGFTILGDEAIALIIDIHRNWLDKRT